MFQVSLCLLGSLLSLHCYLVHSVVLEQMRLNNPLAQCNDGSIATYYVQDADPGPQQNVVIYMQGGGLCINDLSCATRCIEEPSLCEALEDPEITRDEGIFSDDPSINPAFYNYYKVFIPYCSSDIYSGDRAAEDEFGFHFRGVRIVEAVVQDLMTHINLGEASSVIISGGSAGAMGAMRHCDSIAAMLPRVAVKCVPDSGSFSPHNLDPVDPECQGIGGDNFDFNGVCEYWNCTFPTGCANSLPSDQRDRECFFNSIAYKYVQSPVFLSTFKHDGFYANQWCYPECGASNRDDYHQQWDNAMTELANEITESYSHVGLFMPSCWGHVLTESSDLYSRIPAGVDGSTFAQLLNNWMRGSGPIHGWDRCDSPLCNVQCGYDNC